MAKPSHAMRIARDLWRFAMDNKRWWLVPLVLVSLLMIALVVASASPASPFIYTLF